MKVEPATIIAIEVGSFVFFFLFLPLLFVLTNVLRVWEADRGTGLVLIGVIITTGFFFILFFIGLVALAFPGVPTR